MGGTLLVLSFKFKEFLLFRRSKAREVILVRLEIGLGFLANLNELELQFLLAGFKPIFEHISHEVLDADHELCRTLLLLQGLEMLLPLRIKQTAMVQCQLVDQRLHVSFL